MTVNGTTAGRQGEYFYSELALANTNAAAYSSVAIIASMTSGTNNVAVTNTGTAFLPQTPEQFTHDADGNLTSDGRWQYTWDGENRLIGMETDTNKVGAASVPRQKLIFQYDAQSRRISKTVSNWTGSSWVCTNDLRFVYDGWNLLAEVGTTGSVVRSYVWGLDLSGSTTGAGGIGGLLFGTFNGSNSTSSVAYAFDGNGNVSALLDMRTGQLAAEYEYSPFGETIRATGPMAKENPFRFSTKRTDDTTGLILYEYRILNPVTGRWLSRDPVEENGGMNLYQYVRSNPVRFVDPWGLQATKPGTNPATTQCDCICVSEPEKCSITLKWENKSMNLKGASRGAYYYPNNDKQKYQTKFQLMATVTLVHGGGKSVDGCHLRQDTEGHATWATPLGKDWTTPEDYSSTKSKDNAVYHGWWYEDAPGFVSGWDDRPVGTESVWWQAHVTVEEVPKVETWWGFAGSAAWDAKNAPQYGFDVWSGQKKDKFVPKLGSDGFKK